MRSTCIMPQDRRFHDQSLNYIAQSINASINRCFIPRQEAQVFARLAYNHRFVFKPNMREWDLKIQPIIISPSSNQDAVSFTPRIKDQLHIGYRLPHPSGSWCCNLPLINPTLYLICKGKRERKKLLSIITFSIHIELLTFRSLGLQDHWKVSKGSSPARWKRLNIAPPNR